jgi:hypothetical protein
VTGTRPEKGAGLMVGRAILLYLTLAGAGHLAWEAAQLPLYTIWRTGTSRQILFALVHCAAGDVLISAAALACAFLFVRLRRQRLFGRAMIVSTLLVGLGYSVFSEWLNTTIRQTWSYSDAMPVLPPLGTGLAPVLQWLVVPGLALAYVGRRFAGNAR